MNSLEPRSVLLAQAPITGFAHADCLAMLAGPMPRRRCGMLLMALFRDSKRSQDFLCVRVERLAWASDVAPVLETNVHVCHALAIEQRLGDRDDYLKHCIEMLGQRLHCGAGLHTLAQAIAVMNLAWDILGVFQALENLPQHELLN